MNNPNVVTKRDEVLALSNTVLAPLEIVFAVMQRAGTAALDGIHNLTDGLAYWRQLRAIKRQEPDNEPVDQHRHVQTAQERKNTYRLMAWPALGTVALSAYGVAESFAAERSSEVDVGHIGTTAASLAISGLLAWTGRRLKKQMTPDASAELKKDIVDFYAHAKFDVMSSMVAVAGAGLHALGLGIAEQVVGVGIAACQVKRFWPSEKNLTLGLDKCTK